MCYDSLIYDRFNKVSAHKYVTISIDVLSEIYVFSPNSGSLVHRQSHHCSASISNVVRKEL